MSSIRTGIELQDSFSPVLESMVSTVSDAVHSMEQMQQVMNAGVDTGSMDGARADIDAAAASARELAEALAGISAPVINMDQPVMPETVMPNQPRLSNDQLANPPPVTMPVTPAVTDQPVINVPDEIIVPVTASVTDQPVIDIPEEMTVPVTPVVTEQPEIEVTEPDLSGVEQYQQQIQLASAALQQVRERQNEIIAAGQQMDILSDETRSEINATTVQIEQMQQALNQIEQNPLEVDSETTRLQIEALNKSIADTLQTQAQLSDQLKDMSVPVEWQQDFQIFQNTGIERFNAEVQSAQQMLNTLNTTQQNIAQTASGLDILPDAALQDITNLGQRLQGIQQRIQQISSNKLNMGTDEANAELEQLRTQLHGMVQAQEELNAAIDSADPERINAAYLQLSGTIRGTEGYIRDNVSEQGAFNNAINQGTQAASGLNNMIRTAFAGFLGVAGIKKTIGFIQEATELYDTQLNAENQLMTVLANMADWSEVPEFIVGIDDTLALDEFGNLVSTIDGTTVDVTPEMRTDYLLGQFDAVANKASEIQSKGIYGDEAMIAAGAEFATYFTDTDAITTMMDTLSNYAMGMSGGGALDTTQMTDYATNLGKIMTGSYDAMTKKGFEFTEAQKAIIEGTATQDQLTAVLGDDYASLSDEMQAALVISQVIDESWGNLYETMSNTPEGQIIQMTNAWGDMKEMIGQQLYPYIVRFVQIINDNWPQITELVAGFTDALAMVLGILGNMLEGAIEFAQVIQDNWSWIEPIVLGIVAALSAYAVISGIVAVANGIHAASEAAKAAAQMMATGATFAETAAQYGLNAALAACPITWIVLAVIALIAALIAVCQWIANTTGAANSAFGVICGGIATVGAFFKNLGLSIANIAIGVWNWIKAVVTNIGIAFSNLGLSIANIALGIWNALGAVCDNIGIAFHNVIANVTGWWYGLLSDVLTVVAGIAAALNKLPFVEFDYSGIANAASEYAAKSAAAYEGKEDYKSLLSAFQEGMSTYQLNDNYMDTGAAFDAGMDTFDTFQEGWASDAFAAGAEWGDGVSESVSGFFDGFTDMFSTDVEGLSDRGDLATQLANGVGDIGSGVGDIAGNTAAIAGSLDVTKEELKYLRDIAEQEAINRYTTAEIHVDMSGMQNNINNDMDLDGVVSGLTDAVNEAVDELTEGVHD